MSRAAVFMAFVLVLVLAVIHVSAVGISNIGTAPGGTATDALPATAVAILGTPAWELESSDSARLRRSNDVRGGRDHDCELDENDCNSNGVPDACDVDPTDPDGNGEVSEDCNSNGVPDECELATGLPDIEDAYRSPINGHLYLLTGSMNWVSAEAAAVALGGHLATIRSEAENQWLLDTFGPSTSATGAFIGFNDIAVEGEWVWANGEPVTYTKWAAGEPNNVANSDNGVLLFRRSGTSNPGEWLDVPSYISLPGIVEIPFNVDCNSNGVLDECDIAGVTSTDCNGNGIPDECDTDPTDPDGDGEISEDCNANNIPDNCDVDPTDPDGNGQVSDECNANDIPDECELVTGLPDWPDAFRSPINGHLYLLTNAQYWTAAEAEAVSLGGHLATVRSDEENQWLLDTFSPYVTQVGAHIGFTDAEVEGEWVWVSGEPVTYTHWAVDEPDPASGEDYAVLVFNPTGGYLRGDWIDIPDAVSRPGIVELPLEADCNHNLVLDECEIASGASTDCNGNDIPDDCEFGGTEDCDSNGISDLCDIALGTHQDCDENRVPDPCQLDEEDCNSNGMLDPCEPDGRDCNANGVLDECDIAGGAVDCNENSIPDQCELVITVSALDFDGSNDYVDIPDGIWFDGDFTVEAWVMVHSVKDDARLLDFGSGSPGNNVVCALSRLATCKPMLRVLDGTNELYPIVASTAISLNEWVHLAYVVEGSQGLIYMNGELVASDAILPAKRVSRTRNYLARSYWALDGFAHASFDEIRIWNKARPQTEIITNMHRVLPPFAPGLIGYWRCDDGEGQTVTDSSGLMHDGILGGTTDVEDSDPVWLADGSPPINDCNDNGVLDECDIADATSTDCNGNDIPDECEPGGTDDCDSNGVVDLCDLDAGTHEDCNEDGVPDVCQLVDNDCNSDGIPDDCGLLGNDCNTNGIPDECDVDPGDPDGDGQVSDDCNTNGVPDECEIRDASLEVIEQAILNPGNGHYYMLTPSSTNWTANEAYAVSLGGHLATIRSEAENQWLVDTFRTLTTESEAHIGLTDQAEEGTWVWSGGEPVTFTKWGSGQPDNSGNEDYVDLIFASAVWNDNYRDSIGIMELLLSTDCNTNGVLDECDIAGGLSADCNENGWPDECEVGGAEDCDSNGIMDLCDLYAGTHADCDEDGVPDVCQLVDNDCNSNGVPDNCELDDNDCNTNGIPDECDINATDPDGNGEVSNDCNSNGIPDDCEITSGLPGMEGAIRSPINGRLYLLTDPMNWASAEAEAVLLGGHLATIRSEEENQWLVGTFGSLTDEISAHIGFLDAATEGQWVWISGEPVTYTNWGSGEPNNIANEDYGELIFRAENALLPGDWNDVRYSLVRPGIIEIPFDTDCNDNGVLDECDIADDASQDCNENGVPDECEIGGTEDCDSNGIIDLCDLYAGTYGDCDEDGVPDVCQLVDNDCNANGILDHCETNGSDCNTNGIPDECDVDPGDPDGDGVVSDDCNTNGVPDECEIHGAPLEVIEQAILNPGNGHYYILTPSSTSWTANEAYAVSLGGHLATIRSAAENQWLVDTFSALTSESRLYIGFTDEAVEGAWGWVNGDSVTYTNWASGEPNDNGGNEDYAFLRLTTGEWNDYNINGYGLVEFTLTSDCNDNGVLDECDIAGGLSADCNENGMPDECEVGGTEDCDSNGIMDLCDLYAGTYADCDVDSVPDVCQLVDNDCNTNGIPDHCESEGNDCNRNGVLDECDIAGGETDCNTNGVPDSCELVSENRALHFDGSDYVLVPNSDSLAISSSMTIEVWARLENPTSGTQVLLLKGNDDSGHDPYQITKVGSSMRFGFSADAGSFVGVTPSISQFNWQEYHHIAGVFDDAADELRLYVDGNLLGTTTSTLHPQSYHEPHYITIGGTVGSGMRLSGDLDEIRIWSIPLDQATLLANMNGGVTGSEPGLVAYWRFNEAEGQTVLDASSYRNDGRIGANDDPGGDSADPTSIEEGAPTPLTDCNDNGVLDECDIAAGLCEDCNENGVPDECDSCGDLDGDGDVDYADFEIIRAAFGGVTDGVPPHDYCCDYDGSGAVGMADYGTWLRCYRAYIGDPLAGPPEPPEPPSGPQPGIGGFEGPLTPRQPGAGHAEMPSAETEAPTLESVR